MRPETGPSPLICLSCLNTARISCHAQSFFFSSLSLPASFRRFLYWTFSLLCFVFLISFSFYACKASLGRIFAGAGVGEVESVRWSGRGPPNEWKRRRMTVFNFAKSALSRRRLSSFFSACLCEWMRGCLLCRRHRRRSLLPWQR